MKELVKNQWQWLLFTLVMIPVVALFVQQFGTEVDEVSTLLLFPYLGIVAWIVMWTHYVGGVLRRGFELTPSRLYAKFSHYLVTALILLHPALLAYSQQQVTGVLPPQSYWDYVGASAKAAVTAGLIALITFLSYDLYRLVRNSKFWERQRWVIAIMQATAMSLIFWHGLRLGQHLQSGWFRQWWIGLGLLLLIGLYADIKSALDERFVDNAEEDF